MNNFELPSLADQVRAPLLTTVITAIILTTTACSTQNKITYNPPNQRSDPDDFYRRQQELLENQRLQNPYIPSPADQQQNGLYQDQQLDQDQPKSENLQGGARNPENSQNIETDQTGQPETDPTVQQPPSGFPPPNPTSSPVTAKPGENGIVESPFVPGKNVDISGYPPGAAVKDPYTHRIFLVPMPTPNQ